MVSFQFNFFFSVERIGASCTQSLTRLSTTNNYALVTTFSFSLNVITYANENFSNVNATACYSFRKTRSGREFSQFNPLPSMPTSLSVQAPLFDAIHREDSYYYFGEPQDSSMTPLTPLSPSLPSSPPPMPPDSPISSSYSRCSSVSSTYSDNSSDWSHGSFEQASRPSTPPAELASFLLDASPNAATSSFSRKRSFPEDEASSASAAPSKRKRKRYASDKAAATKRRSNRRAARPPTNRAPKAKVLNNHGITPLAIETTLNALNDLPVTSTGYIGRRTKAILQGCAWTLNELLAEGFEVVDWDGITPMAILDHARRIVAVLAGRPPRAAPGEKDQWDTAVAEVAAAIEKARDNFSFADADLLHRRGDFPARLFGVSHGGGQTVRPLCNVLATTLTPGSQHPSIAKQSSSENEAVLEELRLLPALIRIAGFGSSAMAFFAPKLWKHYADTLGKLYTQDSTLRWNFNSSIFPCATINFGPQTVCYDHIDNGNAAAGWCDIFSMGDYNPQTGGHLVLFDIKKIVVFPPGSHILLPSSIMRHGNTPIGVGETRLGFTQYAAGGLFRWVENDFQTVEDCHKNNPKLRAKLDADAPVRFATLLGLYSKLEELVDDRKKVFGIVETEKKK
ncbi:hypothetical protein HWV62_28176 [Athelia sp. TMB]|nr:hypothetical protein HWV62_28176 [Athelia sp. TMB]